MNLTLTAIRDLAYRFVPGRAADDRLYEWGARSWWPAHEIGHFLVATRKECHTYMFGIDGAHENLDTPGARYAIVREVAAMSISQRLLRRSGHVWIADQEIEYTDEYTLDSAFESWCRRRVRNLLRSNKVVRLPTKAEGLETVLTRKAREVGTRFYASRRTAEAR